MIAEPAAAEKPQLHPCAPARGSGRAPEGRSTPCATIVRRTTTGNSSLPRRRCWPLAQAIDPAHPPGPAARLTAFDRKLYNAPQEEQHSRTLRQAEREAPVPVQMELKRIIINEVHDQQVIM